MICHHCKTEKAGDKLPRGWHRTDGSAVCPKCWHERYILRAVTIPVAGPVDCDWPTLRAAIKTAWQKATRLANRAVQELLKADVTRTKDMAKLPKMPPCYLYGACKDEDYTGWAQSAASVLRAVELKYRATRYERIWLGQCRLPDTRYPMPFPVHNAGWKAAWHENGERVPHVTVTLPEAGRITLKLRGGSEFRRQLGDFSQIIAGTAIQGELALFEKGKFGSSHRNGSEGRNGPALMCKMVCWFPRKAEREQSGSLFVATGSEYLFAAFDSDQKIVRTWNWDHAPRRVAEHKRMNQRWSEDRKAEQRPKASFAERQLAAGKKFGNWQKSQCQEAASQLAKLAVRRRVAKVFYSDSDTSFIPEGFCWSALREAVKYALDKENIEWEATSAKDTGK